MLQACRQVVMVEGDMHLGQAFEDVRNGLQQVDRLGVGRHRVAPLFGGFNEMTIQHYGL